MNVIIAEPVSVSRRRGMPGERLDNREFRFTITGMMLSIDHDWMILQALQCIRLHAAATAAAASETTHKPEDEPVPCAIKDSVTSSKKCSSIVIHNIMCFYLEMLPVLKWYGLLWDEMELMTRVTEFNKYDDAFCRSPTWTKPLVECFEAVRTEGNLPTAKGYHGMLCILDILDKEREVPLYSSALEIFQRNELGVKER